MAFKNIISSILTTLFWPNKATAKSSSSSSSPSTAECAVCLSRLKGETSTRVLPCQHEFHSVCVERWLSVPHFKNTCPICRFSLMEEDCGRGDRQSRRLEYCFTEEMVIWFSSFHVAGF